MGYHNALKKKEGVVLLIVITSIMIMTILVLGIITRSTSRILRNEAQARRLKAESFAESLFWYRYQQLSNGVDAADPNQWVSSFPSIAFPDPGYQWDSVPMTASLVTDKGAGPGGSDIIYLNVSY